MRRQLFSSSFALAVSLVFCQLAHAQDPVTPAADPAAGVADAAVEPSPEAAGEAEPTSAPEATTEGASASEPAPEQPRVLEPPNLGPLNVDPNTAGPRLPDPGASAERLQQAAPPEKRGWTLPETVFHLHGYMRLRGTFLRDGALGHQPSYDRAPVIGGEAQHNYDPFPFFTPDDSTTRGAGTPDQVVVAGGCGSSSNGNAGGRCNKHGQVTGDMRLRLKPEIHLSDDVRVKAWIDVLDNVGLGTMGYGPGSQPADLSSSSAMRARRVWGEARNRDIGELRFGRMGADWGLGILDNGGDRYGIDSDFSSDVDRVMGITNLAGFYLMAAYDWANEGKVLGKTQSPSGVPIDRAQRDDVDALTLAAAHKLDAEVQQSALVRGEAVFNYGVYFVYKKQFLQSSDGSNFVDGTSSLASTHYDRLNQRMFTPDLWLQFLWEGLRIELEAVYVAGRREGACPSFATTDTTGGNPLASTKENTTLDYKGTCKFRQLGVALESEYRLFDERLGLHFMSGLASGDSNAYGLAATNNTNYQRSNQNGVADRKVTTYSFHPDYRIDLILWRTIMRRVAGAYYFKPGVSYDFIRDPYGQLAGARIDAVYSRAATRHQTWGDSGNLGLELDLSLYYRSEDGPDLTDGFYGMVQYGILFPFQGLDYKFDGAPKSQNAMILRGVAGIAF